MFGYILANKDALSDAEQQRYRSLYCGLCRQLHKRYGTAARLTLSYDMVFLVLVLSSMYEPKENLLSERCIIHPIKKQPKAQSRFVDYAADMTVLLSYEKVLDDRRDEGGVLSAGAQKALHSAYREASARHPRKAQAISDLLSELYDAEDKNSGIDEGANLFGRVMAEVFDCGESLWGDSLRAFGEALGRFIYVLDAYADFDKDNKKGRYNPLDSNADESVLEVLMGDVSAIFEALPLVQDTGIMRNIIYSGVWIRYRAEKNKRGDRS